MGLSSSRPVASSAAAPVATSTLVTPDAPWVSAVELESAFRLKMSWNLFLNFEAADLDYQFPVKEVPLKGEWAIWIRRENGEVQFRVLHGDGMPVGFFGSKVHVAMQLSWISSDGQQHSLYVAKSTALSLPMAHGDKSYTGGVFSLQPAVWTAPTQVSGGLAPATHRWYRLTCTLEQAAAEDVSAQAVTVEEASSCERAKRVSELNLQQVPHDVRLQFPHSHGTTELWTSSNFLARASLYFVDLFSSDFAESELRTGSSAAEDDGAERPIVEKDFDDSDDETDEVLFSKRPHLLKRSPVVADFPFRQITITQTAFSTYHAILIYLQTGFIHFAPLSSSFPSADLTSRRNDFLAKTLNDEPSLPLPVSPKSVYRLAHLLQLDDLQQIALEAFRSSLTASSVVHELFTDTSLAYDELRAVVVGVVKANWERVRESEEWKEKKVAVRKKRATLEQAAIFMEVLEAVAHG